METVDERKLRLYTFLIEMGRITIADTPEPYKTALLQQGG